MPPPEDAAAKPTTTLFVSYSRKDTRFVDALVEALEARGYDVKVDRSDIAPGEDWRARIEALILAADAVVFVISPDSVARWDLPPPDELVCAWEIRRTVELEKQLVPVVWRGLVGATAPLELSKLNWVSFEAYERSAMRDEAAFAAALDGKRGLRAALNVAEVLWVREHTKWVARAAEWDKAGRPEGKLLRAADVAAVEAWERLRPATAPEIPAVLSDYLAQSTAKEGRDREALNARERRISQEKQRLVAEAARRARETGRHDSAMRLVLASEPTEDELKRGIEPEPSRRAQLAAAAHATLGVACLSGHSGGVRFAAFNIHGTRVVTASRDGTARLWDAASGAELACLRHDDEVWHAAFSADGARVVTASSDKTAKVWDAANGTELACLVHDAQLVSASFTIDGTRVVTNGGDALARVWEATSGGELCRLRHDDQVRSAAFSPDGMRVVTASAGKKAQVWDAASGAELARFAHEGSVMSAAFSPEGALVVTASSDRTARLWDAASGAELARLPHEGSVMSAVFAPDGVRLVTAARDKMARLWHGPSGAELARFVHDSWVETAAFGADGALVVSASQDKTARVWDAANRGRGRTPRPRRWGYERRLQR